MVYRYLVFLALLFGYLFYPLSVGVNVFAFDAVALLVVFASRPRLAHRPAVRWAVFLLLASAVSVVVVNGTVSLTAHHLSFLLLVGFVQERELRFVWYGLMLGIIALLAGPKRYLAELRRRYGRRLPGPDRWVWIRPTLTAMAVGLPFFLLYSIGNTAFFSGLESIFGWLDRVEGFDQVLRFGVVALFGLICSVPLLIAGHDFGLPADGDGDPDRLLRFREGRKRASSSMALRLEYRRAIMVFATLNLLISGVNLTDLRFIWIAAADVPAATLSEYVHVGTNSLIVSILLAMLVVLYFFRRNLNFYPQARTLRMLAYLWLAQNAFLAFSVGVRNWHYVNAYGLAMGRVHVGFGLCLILVGVYSLYRKVRDRKSLRYLLQVNGMAAWLFLVAFGAVNWSGVITRVNLQQSAYRIDWSYLVEDLDRKNYFLLRREEGRIPSRYRRQINRTDQAAGDWRSWNYADWRNGKGGAGARE